MLVRRSPQSGQPGNVPPEHSTRNDNDNISEAESLTLFDVHGMARDFTVSTSSIDPTIGTAASFQTVSASQT